VAGRFAERTAPALPAGSSWEDDLRRWVDRPRAPANGVAGAHTMTSDKEHDVRDAAVRLWIRLGFAIVGIFGIAVAISAVVVNLPAPGVGGTCGPGTGSEAPIVAFFNPASIGAGIEPPTASALAHSLWLAFVGECQSSTDSRILIGLAVLVLSVAFALLGPYLLFKLVRPRRVPAA